MRILYGIQGTGNGHISRARTFLPLLEEVAKVDVLLSGVSSEVALARPVHYRVHGLGFTFGDNGGVDLINSICKFRPFQLIRDIRTLPVHDYDFVISDFEPVTAYAAIRANKFCISLSHQAAFLSPLSPRPEQPSMIGEYIFRKYAPGTRHIGFHYQRYDETIFNPVISQDIRECGQKNHPQKNHITVYLPSYNDRMLANVFLQIRDVTWHIFSKRAQQEYQIENVRISPVDYNTYINSLSGCRAMVCGAGFEAPSEGPFLGKPILAIPMAWQYEQRCNAVALEKLGVAVRARFDTKAADFLAEWINTAKPVCMSYPDQSKEIISRIMNLYELGVSGTRFAV